MIIETEVQCVQANGHGLSGESLALSFDTSAETSTITINRHDRAIRVSLPILLRELARIEAAANAVKVVA